MGGDNHTLHQETHIREQSLCGCVCGVCVGVCGCVVCVHVYTIHCTLLALNEFKIITDLY